MSQNCKLVPTLGLLCLFGMCRGVSAQDLDASSKIGPSSQYLSARADLPDAPAPLLQPDESQSGSTTQSESAQSSTTQSGNTEQKSQRDKAEQQIREEEHQRVLGIVPAFNTTYRADAVPLTAAQ